MSYITEYALTNNILKSLSWKISSGGPDVVISSEASEVVHAVDEELKFLVSNHSPKKCSCGFQLIMKLSCEHVLRVLTEENRENEILDYISCPWMNTISIRNSDRILEELTSIIETERKGLGREERKEQEDFVLPDYCPSKGRIRNEEKERKKFLGEEIAMKSASRHFIKFEKEKKPQQQIEQKAATSTISQKKRN